MRPSERLTVIAMTALAAVTAVTHPEGAALRVFAFGTMAFATVLLATLPVSRRLRFVRDWLPVADVIVSYLLLQPVIEAVGRWRLDPVLLAFDQHYLSGVVAEWRNAFGRPDALTDAAYMAYFSYYLLPITIAAVAWRRGAQSFEAAVWPLLLGFYLSFLGYLLLPALGPRLPLEQEATLGGGLVAESVRHFLHAAETTTLDAFPSGHTAVAVIAGVLASRMLCPAAACLVWVWVAGIVFATVNIHVHYACDVLAGLALALVVIWLRPAPKPLDE